MLLERARDQLEPTPREVHVPAGLFAQLHAAFLADDEAIASGRESIDSRKGPGLAVARLMHHAERLDLKSIIADLEVASDRDHPPELVREAIDEVAPVLAANGQKDAVVLIRELEVFLAGRDRDVGR